MEGLNRVEDGLYSKNGSQLVDCGVMGLTAARRSESKYV